MTVTSETIKDYFDQFGWSYDQLDEDRFLTGFKSDAFDSVPIYVTLTPNWIYFAITPFVQAPQHPNCERKLYKHLLRLCQEINLAKFSVDSDGDIILTVELPLEDLNYSEFSDAMGALSFYADETYFEIEALATDPTAVSSFEQEQDLDWGDA